jgi:class 3 adenylate cyclase/tetratricopeptide (TPR) repeat protein
MSDVGAERKVVTVLFADLVGSTQLGESTDPEALRAQMRRYFTDIRTTVERHGGTVEKFIGDAVMAVFGVPQAREDDALRAVRSAIEICDVVKGHGFEARIGVNTGEVVAGGGDDESLVVGDAVNVAARLEQVAAPGDVLIGAQTRLLVRDAVRLSELEPLELKGKSEPVEAYRLLEVLADAEPVARRLDRPMVGRERERERLWRDYDDAVAHRACRLFTLLGAAGVGKSRLVADFLSRVGSTGDTLRGRCLHYGEGITYWPLVELLGSVGVPADTVVAASPEETKVAFRRLLEARAAERPQVVVIDDLQWAEPTFLDIVEYVAELSRGAPVFLLCVARPELLDVRPGWGGGKLNATSLLLDPLGADECDELVGRLLADAEVDAGTRERIASTSGGNPLFVEELVAVVRERREPGELAIPATIQALLQARLGALPDPERLVLGRAAIEGQVFHAAAVVELLPGDLRSAVDVLLSSLVRKELIRPESLGDTYRFRHLLIRDAAYAAMPKELRADLHARFAGWVDRTTEPTLELDEIVAYHFEQAVRLRGELGLDDDERRTLAAEAAERLVAAGSAAFDRVDFPATIALLRRGLDLLADDDPRRGPALRVLGNALMRRGEFQAAGDALRAAANAAAAAGDRSTEIRAELLLGFIAVRMDPSVSTGVLLDRARELAAELEETDDLATLAFAYQEVGTRRFFLGHAAEGEADLWRAAELARRAGDVAEEHRVLNSLLRPTLWGPTPARGMLALCDRILGSEDVNVGLRVHALQVRAVALALTEEPGAREAAQQAAALIEEYDFRMQRGIYAVDVGFALDLLGDPEAAEAELRRGHAVLSAVGERGVLSTVCGKLASVLTRLGRLDEAEAMAAQGREFATEDDFDAQHRWREALARVHLGRGDLEDAEREARAAVAVVAPTDFVPLEAEALHVLGEVLAAAGRSAEAADTLNGALRLHERKENVVGVRDVCRLLAGTGSPSGR